MTGNGKKLPTLKIFSNLDEKKKLNSCGKSEDFAAKTKCSKRPTLARRNSRNMNASWLRPAPKARNAEAIMNSCVRLLRPRRKSWKKQKNYRRPVFSRPRWRWTIFSKVKKNDKKLYTGNKKTVTKNRNVTQQLRATLTNSVVKIADKNEAAAEFEEKISELEETVLFLEEQIDKLVGKNSKLFGEKQELEGKIVFFSSEITRLSQSNGQPDKNQQQLQIIDLRDDLQDRQKAAVNS